MTPEEFRRAVQRFFGDRAFEVHVDAMEYIGRWDGFTLKGYPWSHFIDIFWDGRQIGTLNPSEIMTEAVR
ncbi:MAG: hypothetical protein KM310_06990 [Clostridiales bacterium]|nr:hypothetical protein [Clostridiales bacterium]